MSRRVEKEGIPSCRNRILSPREYKVTLFLHNGAVQESAWDPTTKSSSGTTQDERHATVPPAVTNLGPVCWKLTQRRFLPSPSTSSTLREWAKVVQVALGLKKEEKETRKRQDTMVVQQEDRKSAWDLTAKS